MASSDKMITQSKNLFDTFKDHCSGDRVDSDMTVLDLIRNAHPDFHVTAVEADACSLLEFAGAGKAVADFEADDETFHASVLWFPVGERLEKKRHPGELKDAHRFARYKYTWEGKDYIVYKVTWQDPFQPKMKMFYVLRPRTDESVVKGRDVDTDRLLLAVGKWTSQLHEEIFVFDNGYWQKSKELWKAVKGSSWDDIILNPETKTNIINDVHGFFDNERLYDEYAVPWRRGIIFHGVPGNGKTVTIKALINSLDARDEPIPTLYVKSFENCQGEQYSIKLIFKQARESGPCLLIFEDLDSLLKDEVRSYFLNEVDGLESNDGILMIGSTNHLDRLDPAISKRPSRFDRKYHFKIPDSAEREAYADYWRKKLLKNERLQFPEELCSYIAKLAEGFSFAYLKELFVMALLTSARGTKLEDLEPPQEDEEQEAEAKSESSLEVVTKESVEDVAPDGKEIKETSTEQPQKSQKCEVCGKCETCGKTLGEDEAEKETEKPTEPQKEKLKMPEVDIPEHLADNYLLNVIRHHIRILHAEMDNTDEGEEDESKSSKKKKTNGMSYNAARMQALANRNKASRQAKRCC
jgi:AAA+ superfamily predicted ATPase